MERTELGLLTPPSASGRETQNLLREGYAFRGARTSPLSLQLTGCTHFVDAETEAR